MPKVKIYEDERYPVYFIGSDFGEFEVDVSQDFLDKYKSIREQDRECQRHLAELYEKAELQKRIDKL